MLVSIVYGSDRLRRHMEWARQTRQGADVERSSWILKMDTTEWRPRKWSNRVDHARQVDKWGRSNRPSIPSCVPEHRVREITFVLPYEAG